MTKFALIGFGEAGAILGEDLVAAGHEVTMYDVLLDSSSGRTQMQEKARRARVRAADTFDDAVKDAKFVISAVTASSSSDVAAKAAGVLRAGQVFLNNYGAGGGVELPFGGVGKSGHGREKGFEALYGFSALKTVAAWHG